MYELHPYFTNDGSVGLFSPEADDIYHSTYGALSEAYEKFIFPADLEKYFEKHSEIKVLDICYGIGYNSKSFLNFLLEKNILNFEKDKKFSSLKNNIETIDANNICNDKIDINNIKIHKNLLPYIDKLYIDNIFTNICSIPFIKKIVNCKNNNEQIYSNNNSGRNTECFDKKYKIYIKALDNDRNLLYLSPFFRQGKESDKKFNKLNFNYEKISKLLNNKFESKYRLDQKINLLLFKTIIEKYPEIFENNDFYQVLSSKKYEPFFDKELIAYFKLLKFERSKYNPVRRFYHSYIIYIITIYQQVIKRH